MPAYDFRCKECDNHEVRHMRVSDLAKPFEPCSECGGEMKKVILSAPTTIYKGKGWFCKNGTYDKHAQAKNGHSGPVSMKEVEQYEKTGKAGF